MVYFPLNLFKDKSIVMKKNHVVWTFASNQDWGSSGMPHSAASQAVPPKTALCTCLILGRREADDRNSLLVFLIGYLRFLLSNIFLKCYPILTTTMCFAPLTISVTFLWVSSNLLSVNRHFFHFYSTCL